MSEENQLAFPYEDTSDQEVTEQKEIMDIPVNGNQTYLAIIGALVTVLAELDEYQARPLKTKKIIRSDGISAKALADILSTRFEEINLPLKRSNTIISEALKLVKEAEKACV